jgi:hypothetical protein
MTDDIERFEIWAPEGGRWSLWAKPVLFAGIGPRALRHVPLRDVPDVESGAYRTAAGEPLAPAVADIPAGSAEAALVIDMPGAESVDIALFAAAAGYRPVPLYAGCYQDVVAAVGQGELREALIEATPYLEARRLPLDAPPAFLLDARRFGMAVPGPGTFDNRWCVFPQDFPSAGLLLHHGIRNVFVIRPEGTIAFDLATVLARYREGGLALALKHPTTGARTPLDDPKARSDSGAPWYRSTVLGSLRPNPGGGFGSVVPQPSSG